MGGSAPIHVIEHGSTEEKLIWPRSAYPFDTEEKFKASLLKLWDKVAIETHND